MRRVTSKETSSSYRHDEEEKSPFQPNTYLEIFGRITKVNPRRKGQDTTFQVITPNTGYILTCTSRYFSPIMVGDAIFAKGFIDENGKIINISRPPFISPGTDSDCVLQAAIIGGGGREKVKPILEEVSKLLTPGETLASRLDDLALAYDHYGNKMLTNLVPESLFQDASKLFVWWYKKRCLRRLYLLDFTNTEIKASGYNPVDLYQIALGNPYRIPSISLEKCETILLRINKTPVMADKYCGEIMRTIKEYLNKKWTYVPRNIITNLYPDFMKYAHRLDDEYGIYLAPKFVALKSIVKIEENVATFIKSLLSIKAKPLSSDEAVILEESLTTFHCDEDQRKATRAILENSLTILTGGAGTGKTTLLKTLIRYLEIRGYNFILTSFTGKAVSRIKEVAPQTKPLTINRLIGHQRSDDEEKQDFHFIFIDETSMLETSLFHDLIKRYPLDKYRYSLVLVGDVNQLPPIGWGCLFQELIESEKITTCYLTQCHRTEGMGILKNAQLLLDGCFFEAMPDFQLCFSKTPLQIIKEHNLPADQVRVLAPFVKVVEKHNKELQEFFSAGFPSIEDGKGRRWFLHDRVMMTKNNYTINVMNGQEGFISFFDPDEEGINVVFNGKPHLFTFRNDDIEKILTFYPPSTGRYLDLDNSEEITPGEAKRRKFHDEHRRIASNNRILFHNFIREIEDTHKEGKKDLNDDTCQYPPVDHLILANALTIHKAQGSEWPYVIVDLSGTEGTEPSGFVTKSLVYVAVTRGIKCIFCIGRKQGWLHGILNVDKKPKQLLATLLK